MLSCIKCCTSLKFCRGRRRKKLRWLPPLTSQPRARWKQHFWHSEGVHIWHCWSHLKLHNRRTRREWRWTRLPLLIGHRPTQSRWSKACFVFINCWKVLNSCLISRQFTISTFAGGGWGGHWGEGEGGGGDQVRWAPHRESSNPTFLASMLCHFSWTQPEFST